MVSDVPVATSDGSSRVQDKGVVESGSQIWGEGGPLGGQNIFCDLLSKNPASKPNSASKEVGKFRCTANT